MQNTFKKSGLCFSIESGLLKVVGLKNLPEHQADEIRQQIKLNKDTIVLAVGCPARCKRTGLCYGTVYFEGKSEKPSDCRIDACPW